ncbi:MAG: hypothetical protein ACI9C4_001998 [Paraglaciecola sp.]|jgi:hypothetical protein
MFNIRLSLLLFFPCFAAMANSSPEVRLGGLKYPDLLAGSSIN